MSTYSENQVRHLYVVKATADVTAAIADSGYLILKDALGNAIRTDLVDPKLVLSATATPAAAMERQLKVIRVAIDTEGLSTSGTPIAGEDYTVRIEYRQFIGKSDEEFYHEFGVAHATSTSTVSSLLLDLATNLAANTKKQEMVAIQVELSDGSYVDVDAVGSGTVAAIIIKEIQQPWIHGIKEETPVMYTVNTGTVTKNGDEVVWGDITDVTTTKGAVIRNGRTIADMEYFFMGERGDQYRMMGWPNYIPTKYMISDADAETSAYDVFDIHYAYVGDNHSVQKSEKTLTIVCPTDQAAGSTTLGTVATAIASEIMKAFGITAL